MRILLDNCVIERFGRELVRQEVTHARQLGWEGLANGNLLKAAELAQFQLLLTVDKNLRFQQNMDHRAIVLITIDTHPVTLDGLREVETALVELIGRVETGSITGRNLVLTKTGWFEHK